MTPAAISFKPLCPVVLNMHTRYIRDTKKRKSNSCSVNLVVLALSHINRTAHKAQNSLQWINTKYNTVQQHASREHLLLTMTKQ